MERWSRGPHSCSDHVAYVDQGSFCIQASSGPWQFQTDKHLSIQLPWSRTDPGGLTISSDFPITDASSEGAGVTDVGNDTLERE